MYYYTSDFDLVLRDLDNGTVETLLESEEVVSFLTVVKPVNNHKITNPME